jgi:mannose/cellobiose epimerase-like protein (N-acyl-D-glucosamine 2-epimerase family)
MDAFQLTATSGSAATTAGKSSLQQLHGPKDVSAAQQAAAFSHSTNSLMNGIIALHTLHRATHSRAVTARLLELLTILCDKAVIGQDVYLNYDDSWRPVGKNNMPVNMIKYGQSLQLPWVVADALTDLAAAGTLPAARAEQRIAKMEGVAAKALQLGLDQQYGGVFEYGLLPDQPGKGAYKLWYVHCEAINALQWLASRAAGEKSSSQQSSYQELLQRTMNFTAAALYDWKFGEMFISATREGLPIPDGGLHAFVKGENWKGAYHSGRMVVNLQRWRNSWCTR